MVEFRVGWGLSGPVVLLNNDSLSNINRFDVFQGLLVGFALPLSLLQVIYNNMLQKSKSVFRSMYSPPVKVFKSKERGRETHCLRRLIKETKVREDVRHRNPHSSSKHNEISKYITY